MATIRLVLNDEDRDFHGDPQTSLLAFLREHEGITSVKDGCSGEGTCGACLVHINGRPRLACRTRMGGLEGARVVTLEGLPERTRDVLASSFVAAGAVQCGFCTPGMIMRSAALLDRTPRPTPVQVRRALRGHLCRCTGYKAIERAVLAAADVLANGGSEPPTSPGEGIGRPLGKVDARATALGRRAFVEDLRFPGMLFGALRFSDHPRAVVTGISTSPACKIDGVVRVLTAEDVPGDRYTGLIVPDWPLMIAPGETTRYIGDVLAVVIARDMSSARRGAAAVGVEYDVLEPVTDPEEAQRPNAPRVHPDRENLLDRCVLRRGDAEAKIEGSAYVARGRYRTQRIEHAFLEREAAVAVPEGDGPERGIHLFSQGQGVYEDRRQIAGLLGVPEDRVRVTLVPTGGGFGGKEDLTVQGHAAVCTHLTGHPVLVGLTRPQSIRMHPKRHPVVMDMAVGADLEGKLTAVTLRAVGDTGAYASVGAKVMERVAGHVTGGYCVPDVDVETRAVYTNNVPCGAMRGFGVNQVVFALESCIEELCAMGGFDPYRFRFDNALVDGERTATGQVVRGAGVRACLEALRPDYARAIKQGMAAGLATGIKNCGIGNGMVDDCSASIEVVSGSEVVVRHGWTEMGQGVDTVAVQVVVQETGIDPSAVRVEVDTAAGLPTGMTTASRATVLLGNALIDACRKLREDFGTKDLAALAGRTYRGAFVCDWTTPPGAATTDPVTHFSYGYAAQMCVVDRTGGIAAVYAAHDAGRIVNPDLFRGQIEGAVHMGLGYALSEELPMDHGYLVSDRLRDCGVLRSDETPEIIVRGVEIPDPVGPYGAKGVGEIGLVPTAAAVANALRAHDGVRRFSLPLEGGVER